ncbi:MAG: (2Fe-2S)-binding protein [Acidobacteria bacterium]|nr:(2Fe-2S)-binding protein [Acidobacteriota bacterium]
MRQIPVTVNGTEHLIEAWPMERLLDLLRRNLGLTGTKEGCGEGECGACAILFNGQLVNSCLIPAAQSAGSTIVTIEGLEDSRLKQAFIDTGGSQCGFCTPGMILASHVLLESNENPSELEIREALAGNLCRCTGFTKIIEAVRKARL